MTVRAPPRYQKQLAVQKGPGCSRAVAQRGHKTQLSKKKATGRVGLPRRRRKQKIGNARPSAVMRRIIERRTYAEASLQSLARETKRCNEAERLRTAHESSPIEIRVPKQQKLDVIQPGKAQEPMNRGVNAEV